MSQKLSGHKKDATIASGVPAASSSHHRAIPKTTSTNNSRLHKKAPAPLDLRRTNYAGPLDLKVKDTKDKDVVKSDREHQQQAPPKRPMTPGVMLSLKQLVTELDLSPDTTATPGKVAMQSPAKPEDVGVEGRCRDCQRSAAFEQAEHELEYKQRHTFIGTASLDDFLEILKLSSDHRTSKDEVANAFTTLAAAEQETARKESLRGGWNLVSRIDATNHHNDYVAHAQIKLGSITLAKFLELMQFDEEEMIGVLAVLQAFGVASYLDAVAGNGTGSKAKAFRQWFVEHHIEKK
jgi:hypothetical protein